MVEELNSALPAVEQVNTDADDLLNDMHEKSTDRADVHEKARVLPQRFAELSERIAQRHAKVQDEVQHGAAFKNAIKDLEDWLPEVNEKVDAQKGVSSNPDVVQAQLKEMEVGCC
jgi:DNA repair exonuclease SbcCD ATPase subunit